MRERLRKGGWVLVAYPVFAVAAFLGLGGERSREQSLPAFVTGMVFLAGGLLYPIVYLGTLALATALRRNGRRITAFKVSALPLAYLTVIGAIGLLWLFFEQD